MERRGWARRLRVQPFRASPGYTLVELLCVCLLLVTLGAVAIPQTMGALSHARTLAAARYLAARMQGARIQATVGGTYAGVRVVVSAGDVSVGTFRDGNRNGLRNADIEAGIDPVVDAPVGLGDLFAGVSAGAATGELVPASADPDVTVFSFSPSGTATSGTVYLRNHGDGQYAVRVLGATGRVRILRFRPLTRDWIDVR